MAGILDARLESKLRAIEDRHEELGRTLADPDVVSEVSRYRTATKAYSDLGPIVDRFRSYRKAAAEMEGARELAVTADDPEMRMLAAEEAKALEGRMEHLVRDLKVLLVPIDPNDAKNIVLEIRAGTGGDEATLFAAEMFRMYTRFAESQGWKVETTDLSESAAGGIKEVIALVEGGRVFSRLKWESGVHRVQRVPVTEAQGRIHTSAVTVAILPEADEVEIHIDEKDLRIDTFCSSGPGGQSVNTTYSAVRITHLPTNTVVQCQDEKSWHKNKAQALKVLRSRLYDFKRREQHEAIAKERRGMIGTGDRSEKIRTYNFPQNRVTDHRISLTIHTLGEFMNGEIAPVLNALSAHEQAELLNEEVQV